MVGNIAFTQEKKEAFYSYMDALKKFIEEADL